MKKDLSKIKKTTENIFNRSLSSLNGVVLIALFCFESLQEKTSEIDYLKLDINILKVEKQQQQAKVTELRSALKSSIQHHKVRQHLLLSGMNAKRLYLLSLFNSTLKPCHSLSHKAHKLYEPTDS